MNIRSMIKHVAAIITAVGMLLASMAGAVTALAEDSKPTTAVDGPTKPVRIMDNLYQTRYTGDYKLDDYLSANAGGNDDYLAWLRANLNHGKPIPLSTTQACTTLAVTDTDTGHDLMVRNMDWYPAVPGMMVATAPTDGYRSVGVAPVMTGKANATPTTDELETSANIAPLTTMDGVNEKGLSAAILQIHRWQAPNDGKPSISQLAVVRLLLDKAATVDEAISLLGRYDIAAYGDKYASLGGLHYALADATGAKATIEFDGGKMHVTRPTDTYQTTTNTMTWDQGAELALHKRIGASLDMAVYFCDPHSPWQRGTNENTNGLLRQYFPKGTDLSVYPEDYLDAVAEELNDRPRKTLGFMKPSEKIIELLDAA